MKTQREKRKRSHKIMTRIGLLTGMAVWGTIMEITPIQVKAIAVQETMTRDTGMDSSVITGQTGTCKWTLQDGVLKIGAGNFAQNGDWLKYKAQIQEIQFTGRVVFPEASFNLFSNLPNLERFLGTENVDTSQVTNMGRMFEGDKKLTTLDLRTWDVSHVWAMPNLFERTSNLRTLHIETWDTSAVTWANYMFSDCGVESLDLSQWNVSQVTEMNSLFYGMSNLRKLDLSGWQTDKVTSMQWMFCEDSRLTDLRLGPKWNTSQVTNMNAMFSGSGLRSLDLRSWDVSRVTNMSQMFWRCSNLNTLNVAGWQTGNVTNMAMMFRKVPAAELAISDWDVSHVTRMEQMLAETRAEVLDVQNWDVRNVVNFEQMFAASNARHIRVGGWQTSSAGSMQKLFYKSNASELDLSGFDMSHLDYQGSGNGYWGDGRVELMLNTMPNLSLLRLGPKTQLKDANGYTVSLDESHDNWQAVGKGTIERPQGAVFTGKQLAATYNAAMADTYVPEVKAAPVTVNYRDLATNEEIQLTTQISGAIDDEFKIDTTVPGYRYQKADGPLTGTFQKEPQEVTLYYLKTAADLGSVTFRFVNDAGQDLLPEETQIGKIGQSYVIAPPKIPGYHLHLESPLPSQGIFTAEAQTLTFLYRQLGQVNVVYVDESGRKIADSRNFEGEYGTAYRLEHFLKGLDSELAGYTFVKSMGPLPGVYGPGITRVGLVFKKNIVVTPNPDPDPDPDPNPGPNPTPDPDPAPTPDPNPGPGITPPTTGKPDEEDNGGAGDLIQNENAGQGDHAVKPQSVHGSSYSQKPERTKHQQKLPATGDSWQNMAAALGVILLAGLGLWGYRQRSRRK